MFTSIIESTTTTGASLTIQTALVCSLASIIFGFIIAGFYMVKTEYTKSYVITLVLLPMLTQVIIMMVNGNLGTGIAIMGAFSLVRFRSIPGGAKQILGIFFAMGVGLATGMGYITFAAMVTFIVGIVMMVLQLVPFGEQKERTNVLRITIPEDVDYTDVFDDVFAQYTKKNELARIKTTNMGTMLELNYNIIMKNEAQTKEMIDEIRSRNGNLTVILTRLPDAVAEL
ncbi:MAG: DUF4956 domain-containing protein [Lachnospiraceae bacterium]|nr:DUF4956 domain-containing protein [Lachnospiraceae bacterium]